MLKKACDIVGTFRRSGRYAPSPRCAAGYIDLDLYKHTYIVVGKLNDVKPSGGTQLTEGSQPLLGSSAPARVARILLERKSEFQTKDCGIYLNKDKLNQRNNPCVCYQTDVLRKQ